MKALPEADVLDLIREHLREAGLPTAEVDRRDYPEETIFVVRVPSSDVPRAAKVGNTIDRELEARGIRGFVTVRGLEPDSKRRGRLKTGVADKRSKDLAGLLAARARTSEVQSSLTYIPDTGDNLSKMITARQNLIFGRRGAGKTALLLEAKRVITERGDFSIWLNMHTLRRESAFRCFLWFISSVCDVIQVTLKDRAQPLLAYRHATDLRSSVDALLSAPNAARDQVLQLVPRTRSVIRRFLETEQRRLFVFIDDLHYLQRSEQAEFLDVVHGAIRDVDAWLKVATIKHLTRWFLPSPPTGLQTGHDAHPIDLDVSLQDPGRAKQFLDALLISYARHVGIDFISSIFASGVQERLVLASGGVPRDYMELSAASIREAQRRANAKLVGVQDVNKAAGDAANVKITELEEDAASSGGEAGKIVMAFQVVRKFCLDEKKYSYFRIDFRDKEQFLQEYSLMQSLMDLRLIHLVNPSVSDPHAAGRRAEVFMLDLSQFSGQRLKKKLHVLDFRGGQIEMKTTGTAERAKVGNTPRKLIGLLRNGPLFELRLLSATLN